MLNPDDYHLNMLLRNHGWFIWVIISIIYLKYQLCSHDDVIKWKHFFLVTGPLWGEFIGHRWNPLTKASEAEPWCFFNLRLNKRLSKQSWGWWFETLRSLWRHCNESYHEHIGALTARSTCLNSVSCVFPIYHLPPCIWGSMISVGPFMC